VTGAWLAALCLLEQVVIAGRTLNLEIAADPPARARGLMGREEIAGDGGMIFVFPREGRRSFWMKSCPVDIDLLFLDRAGRIVSVHRMKAEPPRRGDETESRYEARLPGYPSRRPAQFAIELRAGSIDALTLETGQVIALDLPKLRKLAR
jgi:uncharacterized membrane protein (UPF0127 family)